MLNLTCDEIMITRQQNFQFQKETSFYQNFVSIEVNNVLKNPHFLDRFPRVQKKCEMEYNNLKFIFLSMLIALHPLTQNLRWSIDIKSMGKHIELIERR